ncbi:MAG: C-terminal binding protein [Dethiobacteria bacterium]|nr:C-terminal binding protein [Bacillota bacterium]
MKEKVVICDYEFPNIDREREIVEGYGAELVAGQGKDKGEQYLIDLLKDADGIINQYSKLTANVINALEKCKVIVTYGIGVDKIDVEAASKKGIIVSNVPDYCIEEVADHAFAMLMALGRGLFKLDRCTKKGNWSFRNAAPLFRTSECTVGIIGFGRIGSMLAKKISAYRFKDIIAYDPYVNRQTIESYGVKKVEFEQVLRESDYLSIHAPLTEETRHMISEDELRKMKSTAYLINVGRGPIIDGSALYKALSEGWIAGAGLDVFEEEPLSPDSPLLTLDNLIATPHAAFYSKQSLIELQTKAAEEVVRVLSGNPPRSAVNLNDISKK